MCQTPSDVCGLVTYVRTYKKQSKKGGVDFRLTGQGQPFSCSLTNDVRLASIKAALTSTAWLGFSIHLFISCVDFVFVYLPLSFFSVYRFDLTVVSVSASFVVVVVFSRHTTGSFPSKGKGKERRLINESRLVS